MTSPILRVGGPELAEGVAEAISRAFATNAVTSYFTRTSDTNWTGNSVPYELVIRDFKKSVPRKARLGAHLVEAGNFAAVAVWFPPHVVDHGKVAEDNERIRAYTREVNRVKQQWMQGRKHWYLSLIARHPQRKEKGVIRALIQPYLEKAKAEGVPAWLEAADEHSRDVYAHFGFRTTETFRVGVGEFNSRGEFEVGGEGVPVFPMIYE
ncbi:uncharacterized protein BDV17DRAFT_251426 [Aspergillus undulatus]|uniref:uncharacterized protein n=1 Tax=Aspergillus undulatus TaxID=1810928 RepID=UPI003CCD09E0